MGKKNGTLPTAAELLEETGGPRSQAKAKKPKTKIVKSTKQFEKYLRKGYEE